MSNHLSQEKSPYLLQHADNPVDWYPWGEEAFKKAREENRPIFLSVGYATCHWCHVMAHESFEDIEVARLLNQFFVAIKVDREERPDIDQVYMSVCQALTGKGGWPLSVFLTPAGKPFFAGTYFPKTSRMGMSGFIELLTQIAGLWQRDQERIIKAGEETLRAIQDKTGWEPTGSPLTLQTLEMGYDQQVRSFDPQWGGFGSAPKFPTPHHLTFLMRWQKRSQDPKAGDMVGKTLKAMRLGGIFDHIGLGFHRYSVDAQWLVPHFEKMLYDQALLSMAYLEAYQLYRDPFYAKVTREIFTYVLRDMKSPEGGFYSAEDADSEGEEGLFYVWTDRQIQEVLPPDLAALFIRFYDVTPKGNFEKGMSIPHMPLSWEAFAEKEGLPVEELMGRLEKARKELFAVREKRIHPLKDDKILTSWNGLMIAALAKGGQALHDPGYTGAACTAADFILKSMRTPSGGLFRRYREGQLAHPGFLEDYAFFVWGLIELYEATFDLRYLEEALLLNQRQLDLFWDEEKGGCFFTPRDGEQLITREKDLYDGATPSGNSITALNLLRLGRMTGQTVLEEKADQLMRYFSKTVSNYPMAYTQFLNALDFVIGPAQEMVIAGDPSLEGTAQLIRKVRKNFLPNKVLLLRPSGEKEARRACAVSPFLENMISLNQQPTVYLCSQYACQNPITDEAELETILQKTSGSL